MNPSNTQVTPEIKKVIDSNGDGHTVIPTPHGHAQSEVSGLATALAAKADTSTVNAALNGKASVAQVNAKASKVSGAVSGHFAGLDSNGDLTDSGVSASSFSNRVAAGTNGSIIVAEASGKIGRSPKTIADLMPATTIDSTPTANSTNLVTSGGVAAALAKKSDKRATLVFTCDTRDEVNTLYPDDDTRNDLELWANDSSWIGVPNKVDIVLEITTVNMQTDDPIKFKTAGSIFYAKDSHGYVNSAYILIGGEIYDCPVSYSGGEAYLSDSKFTLIGTLHQLQ